MRHRRQIRAENRRADPRQPRRTGIICDIADRGVELRQHKLSLRLAQGHETHRRRDKACREGLQVKRTDRRIIEGKPAHRRSQHNRIGPRHPVANAQRGERLGQGAALRSGFCNTFARPGQGQRKITQDRQIFFSPARGQHQDRIIAPRPHGQHRRDPLRKPRAIAHPPLHDLGLQPMGIGIG